jgi:hypothetical protein
MDVLLGMKKDSKKHYVYPEATVSYNTADRLLENTLIETPELLLRCYHPALRIAIVV